MLKKTQKFFSQLSFDKQYVYKGISAECFNESVTAIDYYSRILPLCRKSEIIKYYNQNEFDALLEINFGVFQDSYISHVKCQQYIENDKKIYDVVSEAQHDSIMKYLYSRWKFYEDKGDKLVVNYELKMEMQNQMQQLMVKAMNNIIARQTIKAISERAREIQNIVNKSKAKES